MNRLTSSLCMLLLSMGLHLSTATAAEIEANSEKCARAGCIYLGGEITSGDLLKFIAAYESKARKRTFIDGREYVTVQLNSNGGQLSEAMGIGRFMRSKKPQVVMQVAMDMNAECYSSCVFILAAAIGKPISYELWRNKVGIHRPYLIARSNEGFDAAVKGALAASRVYFAEMNIPEQLADDMFSIAPTDLKVLTDDELERYRLNQVDMAWSEEMDLEAALYHGMTRQEYMLKSRMAREDAKKCFPIKDQAQARKCISDSYRKYGFKSYDTPK